MSTAQAKTGQDGTGLLFQTLFLKAFIYFYLLLLSLNISAWDFHCLFLFISLFLLIDFLLS